ncbi:hypothetical protein BH09ACT5_BH09ACT5_20160 [soil metagenome]
MAVIRDPFSRAQHAAAVLGASLPRLDVLRFALTAGEFTVVQAAAELEMSRSSVRMHLVALEETGILCSRRARQPRGAGAVRYWTLKERAVDEIVDDLESYFAS